MEKLLAARVGAARILAQVERGDSLGKQLPHALTKIKPEQRALAQELVYGTLREWPRLQGLADQLLAKPLRAKDGDVKALVLMGIHELTAMRTPDHATVAETVAATRLLGKPWAAGLVNGCLRNYQRRQEALESHLNDWQKQALPEWLWQALQRQWPGHLDQIARSQRNRPPLTLRVNQQRTTSQDYLALLRESGIKAQAVAPLATAITLDKPCPVEELPGFSSGLCSVQDAAAQLAAPLLALEGGEQVLDACAAPGGKASHLLEQAGAATLIAADISEERLQRVEENLQRLGLKAEMRILDAATASTTLSGAEFPAILVDAPCSATGVMRRNPDIKIHRQPEDVAHFAAQQASILEGLWPLLGAAGRLLYVTCSILREENDQVIEAFLRNNGDAQVMAITEAFGEATEYGLQTLPEETGADGLYYALLTKRAHQPKPEMR